MGFLGWLFGRKEQGLRAVPGATAYADMRGKVVYSTLDPWMQQFMGRCIGALKKAGMRAKGTGQFSILVGDEESVELGLDDFWEEFRKTQDEAVFRRVVEAARTMMKK